MTGEEIINSRSQVRISALYITPSFVTLISE